MQKKWLFINIVIILLIVIGLISVSWTFSFKDTVVPREECIDVNQVASFVYDACYDAYSKNIFLESKRSLDTYKVNALDVSFFDFAEQNYKLTDVPDTKSSKAYKIPAEKNPQNIYISLDILKDFSAPVCDEPRAIFVRYCPVGNQEEDVGVSISPLGDERLAEDFIEIQRSPRQDSDVLGMSLVEKERIWMSKCESRWKCTEWEECENGIQRRTCEDTKDCFIPTGMPETIQNCDGKCVENWECEWSDCRGGFTVPKCKDLNGCGTSYSVPNKLECGRASSCVPDIECSGWTECDVDYNFMSLVGDSISDLSGTKSRICVDNNGCVETSEEEKECSVAMDIYTKRVTKCGEQFIGVYNRLNNDLIAKIKRGTGDKPYLNIDLDGNDDSSYCDYCFNGILDGDEEGVDCGGSCKPCVDKYRRTDYKKQTSWTLFVNWVKRMLT
jgi:hypothetical protein